MLSVLDAFDRTQGSVRKRCVGQASEEVDESANEPEDRDDEGDDRDRRLRVFHDDDAKHDADDASKGHQPPIIGVRVKHRNEEPYDSSDNHEQSDGDRHDRERCPWPEDQEATNDDAGESRNKKQPPALLEL